MVGTAPDKKAKVGNVDVAGWTKTNAKGSYTSYTINKQYFDKNTKGYKKSNSYFEQDMKDLAKALKELGFTAE